MVIKILLLIAVLGLLAVIGPVYKWLDERNDDSE